MEKMKLVQIHKEIQRKKTLYNVFFDYNFKLDKRKLKPASKEDEAERKHIFKTLNVLIRVLKKDKNTRQACCALTYNTQEMLCKCPAFYHFYIGKQRINIVVYMRSWHYLKNFDYDIQTFNLALYEVSKALKIKPGKITFIVHSLHLSK